MHYFRKQPPSFEGDCTFTMLQFYLQEPVVHWQFYEDKCGSFQCFHAPSDRQAEQYHYTSKESSLHIYGGMSADKPPFYQDHIYLHNF